MPIGTEDEAPVAELGQDPIMLCRSWEPGNMITNYLQIILLRQYGYYTSIRIMLYNCIERSEMSSNENSIRLIVWRRHHMII